MAVSGPIYQRPYARMGVYYVGILTGYLLYKTKCQLWMNKVMVAVGWIVAISSALAVIYGPYHYKHDNVTMPLGVSMLYSSVPSSIWGVCFAWLVIACASGYGGRSLTMCRSSQKFVNPSIPEAEELHHWFINTGKQMKFTGFT